MDSTVRLISSSKISSLMNLCDLDRRLMNFSNISVNFAFISRKFRNYSKNYIGTVVCCFGAGQRPRIKVFLTLGLHHVSRFQKKNKQNQLSKATAAYQFNVKNLKSLGKYKMFHLVHVVLWSKGGNLPQSSSFVV